MNAIEIKNLCKAYQGFKLDSLSLTLPSGCIMGLIGENGAGKTTAIKLMLNIVRRDSGSVSLLGRTDQESRLTALKEDIGVVPDEIGLPGCLNAKQVGKIMERTFKNWREEAYLSYLRRLSLPSDKPFKDLSTGMKTKLGIALALSHDPRLLILDEPTSGLDPVVRDEVIDIFNDFTRDENHSILISSHIVSDLEKLCDYIAFLHKGKLLLCEEKDLLTEQYAIARGCAKQLATADPGAVIGKKQTEYGVEAIMRRADIPPGMAVSPAGIEELFVSMVKGRDSI